MVKFIREMQKDAESRKYPEFLKSKETFKDFIMEINNCMKNLMRLLRETTPENCMGMYCLDMLWKSTLVRLELLMEADRNTIL